MGGYAKRYDGDGHTSPWLLVAMGAFILACWIWCNWRQWRHWLIEPPPASWFRDVWLWRAYFSAAVVSVSWTIIGAMTRTLTPWVFAAYAAWAGTACVGYALRLGRESERKATAEPLQSME